MTLDEDFQAALDLLALAHSIEPFRLRPESAGHPYPNAIWLLNGECPLTHAARVLTGERYLSYRYYGAGASLGMSPDLAARVVRAADGWMGEVSEREALRSVYGLPPERRF